MRIVVEGPDNSGKTTLIDYLARHLVSPETGRRFNVFRNLGPCVDLREYRDRIAAVYHATDTIFDRHTVVSENIYGPICRAIDYGAQDVRPAIDFYAQRPIFIYCRGRDLAQHIPNHARDTPEHLAAVAANHGKICAAYDRWALRYAHILYRLGDLPLSATLEQVQAMVAYCQMELAL